MKKQEIKYEVVINGVPDFTQIPDKAISPFLDELLIGFEKYLSDNAGNGDEHITPQG